MDTSEYIARQEARRLAKKEAQKKMWQTDKTSYLRWKIKDIKVRINPPQTKEDMFELFK